jgi:mannosyltransferase OCH1-like enzyme
MEAATAARSPSAAEILIPRTIHRMWLGPNPIPEVFEHYWETWARHHSGWDLRTWTDDTLPPLANQAEVDRSSSFKTLYDMVRYEVLRQFGGVIIDMDMECIRSLEPLLPGVSCFVPLITPREHRVGVQVMGAVPHHPMLERAVELLRDTAGLQARTGLAGSHEAGPAFLSRVVDEFRDQVTLFPREAFLSPLTIEPPKRPGRFPQIYAVHHNTESWREGGAEARLHTLELRLAKAQAEIHRLTNQHEKALALAEKTRRRAERAVRRIERDAGASATAKRLARAEARLRAVSTSRWWRLGRRLRIVKAP